MTIILAFLAGACVATGVSSFVWLQRLRTILENIQLVRESEAWGRRFEQAGYEDFDIITGGPNPNRRPDYEEEKP